MAVWKITNRHKKNAVERQIWVKDGKVIIREEGFRWGIWSCDSEEQPNIDLDNPDGYELMATDYDWEMEEMIDGCWAETTVGNEDTTDEDLEEFETAWEEDSYEAVEELGWINDDTEHWIYGPLQLTNEDTGEEFVGDD